MMLWKTGPPFLFGFSVTFQIGELLSLKLQVGENATAVRFQGGWIVGFWSIWVMKTNHPLGKWDNIWESMAAKTKSEQWMSASFFQGDFLTSQLEVTEQKTLKRSRIKHPKRSLGRRISYVFLIAHLDRTEDSWHGRRMLSAKFFVAGLRRWGRTGNW